MSALAAELRLAMEAAAEGDVKGARAIALLACLDEAGADRQPAHASASTLAILSALWAAVAPAIRERIRQQVSRGYTTDHDNDHAGGELAAAAAALILPPSLADEPLLSNALCHPGDGPTLLSLIKGNTFSVKAAFNNDEFYREKFPEEQSTDALQARIHDLGVGVALCLAEIERLQRAEPQA